MLTQSEMTNLLSEAETQHELLRNSLPPHDWTIWYGAYLSVRARFGLPTVALKAAHEAVFDHRSSEEITLATDESDLFI